MKYLETIYKYMPLRPEFVSNSLLRLTPRCDLNDPYDYYPMESDILEAEKQYEAHGVRDISKKQITDNYLNGIGVISFTESIDSILMWSHYADGHKGMAVGFDIGHDFFKDKIERVRYSAQRPDFSKFQQREFMNELTSKSDQWIYEKEWRFVATFSEVNIGMKKVEKGFEKVLYNEATYNPNVMAMVEVPKDAIKSITFGFNVDYEKIRNIKQVIESDAILSHVVLRRMEMEANRYELKIIPITSDFPTKKLG